MVQKWKLSIASMVTTSRQRCGTSAIEGVGHDTKTPLYIIKYRIKSLPNKLGVRASCLWWSCDTFTSVL
jgi:hypothetical protein